ncbi:MAG: acyl-CoA dehydrogenase family protein [Dehalococcoidia bacterium]|jgi:alkylation response protein AidB-like acyl-CoA dehydrogenase
MDFSLSEEQVMFADSVEKFGKNEFAPTANDRERKGEFSYEYWKKLAGYGLAGLCIPSEYGGGGANAMMTVLGLQAFAKGSTDMSICVVWGSHLLLCAMPIAELGTDAQKKKYLPGMARGEKIGAMALTEPEAGSEATALKTTAKKEDNYYILNGSKTFISNAPIADVFVVFASVDLSKRAGGITIFIVEKDTPGLTLGKPLDKYAGHAAPTGEMFFDGCKVPVENLLGAEGEGFQAMLMSLGWERIAFAPYVGIMDAELNACIEYAKERKQFGKPIAKHQFVQGMLAEMKMNLEASRYLTYHLAWKKDRNEFIGLDAAIAKTFITEAAEENSRKAVQIFGGYGCMRDYPVGSNLWAAKMAVIGGGTSQIQRTVIARMITGI